MGMKTTLRLPESPLGFGKEDELRKLFLERLSQRIGTAA